MRRARLPPALALLCATALLCVAASLSAARVARAQLLDGVAAIVDKDVILYSDVQLTARITLERLQQRGPLSQQTVETVFREALQTLIESRLLEQYAKRAKLVAEPEEIERAVESIAVDEGVTPDAIYAAAESQGLSREAYRRELGAQITRMKVMSGAVRQRVSVSDEEVRALYDERYASQEPGMRVRARHLLLPWPQTEKDGNGQPLESTKELEKKRMRMREIAGEIRERAIETGDFASLAQQYSRAPSALDGGLTTFRAGEVADEIRAAIFELPPGEITPVIETEHGLNVFQIVNRFDPAEVSYEDVEANLRLELIERKVKPEFVEWIGELKEHRYIEILAVELRP